MLETDNNREVRSIVVLETTEGDGAENLLEKILHRNNLNAAYMKVKRNGGAPGIDEMTVEQMLPYLKPIKTNYWRI